MKTAKMFMKTISLICVLTLICNNSLYAMPLSLQRDTLAPGSMFDQEERLLADASGRGKYVAGHAAVVDEGKLLKQFAQTVSSLMAKIREFMFKAKAEILNDDELNRRQFLLFSGTMLALLSLVGLCCRTQIVDETGEEEEETGGDTGKDTGEETEPEQDELLIGKAVKGFDFLAAMMGQVDDSYGNLVLSFEHEGQEVSWIFNNAEAVSAFIQGYNYFMAEGNNREKAQEYLANAKKIADSLLALQQEEGWWYNGYVRPGVPYLVPQNGTYIGPMAAVVRSMLELYEVNNQAQYLESAELALTWIKARQNTDGGINHGAIRAGVDDSREDIAWVSTEENIRAARALMKHWLLTGNEDSYALALDIANWLIEKMWDGTRFDIGTTANDEGEYEINDNVALALDVQHLAIIFLAEMYEHSAEDKYNYSNYTSALEWVRQFLSTVEYEGQSVSGYGKVLNGDCTSVEDWEGWDLPNYIWNNVWVEGTLGHAYAERLAGNEEQYEYLMAEMLKVFNDSRGAFPHIIGELPEEETGWGWPVDYRYFAVDSVSNFIYLVLGKKTNQEPFAKAIKRAAPAAKAVIPLLRRFFPSAYWSGREYGKDKEYENIIAPSIEEHGLLAEYIISPGYKDYCGKKVIEIINDVLFDEELSFVSKFFYLFGYRTIPLLLGLLNLTFTLLGFVPVAAITSLVTMFTLGFLMIPFILEHKEDKSIKGAVVMNMMIVVAYLAAFLVAVTPTGIFVSFTIIIISPLLIHSGWNELMDIIDQPDYKAICWLSDAQRRLYEAGLEKLRREKGRNISCQDIIEKQLASSV